MKKESFRYEWVSIWQQFVSDPDRAKKRNAWWQGESAYKELAGAGVVQLLLPPEGAPMLRILLQHVKHFRKFLKDAIAEHRTYEKIVTAFEESRAAFEKHAATVPVLKEWESRMRVEAWFSRQHQQEFWKLRLLPYDRSSWKRPKWIYGNLEGTRDLPVPPINVERAEEIFGRAIYPQDYTSPVNLHTWLQLRAAVIFKLFLSERLTTLTAARLVVLLYGVAELGVQKHDSNGKLYLRIPGLPRPLTVPGLYEKLQRYYLFPASRSRRYYLAGRSAPHSGSFTARIFRLSYRRQPVINPSTHPHLCTSSMKSSLRDLTVPRCQLFSVRNTRSTGRPWNLKAARLSVYSMASD